MKDAEITAEDFGLPEYESNYIRPM